MIRLLSVFLCVFAMSLCCRAGIFSSEDEDICKKANKYRLQGDMAQAFENYMIAARLGNAEAMAWVGAMYDVGGVCEQSYEEAFNWSLKAANAGDAMSFYTLGDYFYKGIGVRKDRVKAMNMWDIAAEKKVPCAIQQMNKISPAGKKAYEEYKFLDTLEETLKNMKDPKDARVENKEGSKDVRIFTHTNITEINAAGDGVRADLDFYRLSILAGDGVLRRRADIEPTSYQLSNRLSMLEKAQKKNKDIGYQLSYRLSMFEKAQKNQKDIKHTETAKDIGYQLSYRLSILEKAQETQKYSEYQLSNRLSILEKVQKTQTDSDYQLSNRLSILEKVQKTQTDSEHTETAEINAAGDGVRADFQPSNYELSNRLSVLEKVQETQMDSEYQLSNRLSILEKVQETQMDSELGTGVGSASFAKANSAPMLPGLYECVLNFSEHKRTGVEGLVSVKILGRLAPDGGGKGAGNKNELELFRTVIGKKYGEPSDVSDFPILKKLIPGLTDMVFWEGEYQLVVLGVDKESLRSTIIISPLLAAIAYERDSAVKESQSGF